MHQRVKIKPFVPNASFLYLLKTLERMKIIGKGCIGNNWLNCLQERSLLVYNDQISTFEELLQRDRKINRNIQGLAIELQS